MKRILPLPIALILVVVLEPVAFADSLPPVISPPGFGLTGGRNVTSSSLQSYYYFHISDSDGICSVEVQLSENGGGYVSLPLPGPADGRTTYSGGGLTTLKAGRTYDLRERATDCIGNGSEWVNGPLVIPRLYGEERSSISYSSGWRRGQVAGSLGGFVKYSRKTGATATVSFTGSSIAWFSTLGPDRGRARVYVDGAVIFGQGILNLYSPSTLPATAPWSWVFAGPSGDQRGTYFAHHTVRVSVIETATRPRVDVDAFAVMTRA